MKQKRWSLLLVALALLLLCGSTAWASTSEPATGIMGDADSDGELGASDAAAILRHLVELDRLSYAEGILADVDHDGVITAMDASAILRYLVELTTDYEVRADRNTTDGLYSFNAYRNESTILSYLGNQTEIAFPRAMEGHPVVAVKAGAFAGKGISSVRFMGEPVDGLAQAGFAAGTIFYYPAPYAQAWQNAGLGNYTLTAYTPETMGVSFTVSNTTLGYNGSKQGIAAVPNADVDFIVTYKNAAGQTVEPRNAGSYSYVITVTTVGYYATGSNITGSFVIEKANYPQPKFENKSFKQEDDVELHEFSIYAENVPEGVSVSYTYYMYNKSSRTYEPTGLQYGKFEGEYKVEARFTGDYSNYNAIPMMTAYMTITSDWSGGWMSID